VSSITLKQQDGSLIPSPTSGDVKLFVDSDGSVKTKNSLNDIEALGGEASGLKSATTTVDVSGATAPVSYTHLTLPTM
jgi:hypothetical protein